MPKLDIGDNVKVIKLDETNLASLKIGDVGIITFQDPSYVKNLHHVVFHDKFGDFTYDWFNDDELSLVD